MMWKYGLKTACALAIGLILPTVWAGPQIITLPAPEGDADLRSTYVTHLVTLALEKTRAEYGDYQINFTPEVMNTARLQAEVRKNSYPNLMFHDSFQDQILDQGLDYTRFPIELGITGYRICFISPQAESIAAQAKSLDDLKKLTIGQGVGWADVAILRHNGFTVQEISKYESLFRMVAANRIDLFCRGISEIEDELKAHANIADLDYDRTFALAYPLPRALISNKQNHKALERISKGLQLAYKDGSLRKLWQAQYGSALRFAKLKQRKIYYLDTPNIKRIDYDYQKYYFDPRK